jgi:DNA-binding response OmpR family regulator
VAFPPQILLVTPSADVARTVTRAFHGAEFQILTFTDFSAARIAVERRPPDLLISEVRLGAYNGLHLAIIARCRQATTRAILIGPPDPVMEAEANRQQVTYLAAGTDGQAMLQAEARIVSDLNPPTVH